MRSKLAGFIDVWTKPDRVGLSHDENGLTLTIEGDGKFTKLNFDVVDGVLLKTKDVEHPE